MSLITATVLMNRLQAKAKLRHLQVLVMLGELHSVKKTAESIGLSQPAVSQLLADLESLLDVALFDRLARGVQPTPAGRELIPIAARILETMAQGTEALTALKLQGKGSVRIAAIAGAISGFLSQAIPAFSLAHPHIQLHVMETGSKEWALLLARGDIDLAVCREPRTPPQGCRFWPLMPDRFVIACGPQHPLLRRKALNWPDLFRRTWLPPPVGTSARTVFDQLMNEHEVQAPLSSVVTRVSSLTWAMLKQQHLLTLVPFGVVRQWVDAGELAVMEPPAPLPFTPVGLVMPQEGLSSAAQTFADFVASLQGPAQEQDAQALA